MRLPFTVIEFFDVFARCNEAVRPIRIVLAALALAAVGTSCGGRHRDAGAVPMVLDHNRMLIDGEFQRADGAWRPARLWVDAGNPDLFMSEAFARDLGIDLSAAGERTENGRLEVPPPAGVRIGGTEIDFTGVKSYVLFEPTWLFSTMRNDANLPSTVMQRYRIVFDYPRSLFTIGAPEDLERRGLRAPAAVNRETGIVQIDALIDGDTVSFALDNGASYSFASETLLARFAERHPEWPRSAGAVGCANIWGWWPGEGSWPVVRIPEILWGGVPLRDVGVVGLPESFPLASWYSRKTARPVDGLLGPNAFKAFRVEIDYAGSAVYFEKGTDFDSHDMDVVGLTLRPMADGGYEVIAIASIDGKPSVEGVEPGDRLVRAGDVEVSGATMGRVVDALRGAPGDTRTLLLEREGKRFTVEARVERFL